MSSNTHSLSISHDELRSHCTDNLEHVGHNIKLCPHCDLLVELPALDVGQRAGCPRCDALLTIRYYKDPFILPTIYAFSALFMLVLALLFPFVDMNIAGRFTQIVVSDIPNAMSEDNYTFITYVFITFVLFNPVFCSIAVILLCSNLRLPKVLTIYLARFLFLLKPWCMEEIFLAGVLVSFVKLMAYGEIGLGISFFPYCLFCLLELKMFQYINADMIWQRIGTAPALPHQPEVGRGGMQQGLRLCQCCQAILPYNQLTCPRCNTNGYVRIRNSIQWTLALLFTSVLLYIPANILPMMWTTALGSSIASTIYSGVVLIWNEGSYPIAIIIFTASIMIPILKILAISWLCYSIRNDNDKNNERMQSIYEIVEFVGRWSMIDVFVIGVLTALIRMGNFMMVAPAPGIIFFASVVILTMISAHMFDSRLIWDRTTDAKSVEKDV